MYRSSFSARMPANGETSICTKFGKSAASTLVRVSKLWMNSGRRQIRPNRFEQIEVANSCAVE